MNLGELNNLLEIIEDRHGLRTTLVSSQLPITQWQKAIGGETLVDTIFDRLRQNS